jgi:hypothetical protein
MNEANQDTEQPASSPDADGQPQPSSIWVLVGYLGASICALVAAYRAMNESPAWPFGIAAGVFALIGTLSADSGESGAAKTQDARK